MNDWDEKYQQATAKLREAEAQYRLVAPLYNHILAKLEAAQSEVSRLFQQRVALNGEMPTDIT